jgi:DegV family protein with EDD domain
VVTDSCASLPDSFWDAYGIIMVPYYLNIGKESYRDLSEVDRDSFFQQLATADPLPTTANPGPGDYLAVYEKAAEDVQEIASIHMTSIASGAYQAATIAKNMAAESLPHVRIEVIDTRNVSMCHGWMALEAARAAQEGAGLDEIVGLVDDIIPKAKMLQTADTLRYLYKGGRIGKAKHLFGTLLSIKPIIGMEDGVIVPLGQGRSLKAVYRKMLGIIGEATPPGGEIKAAVVHAAAPDEAERLRQMVEDAFPCKEMLVTRLSPVLGVHSGPVTVGVCFYPL